MKIIIRTLAVAICLLCLLAAPLRTSFAETRYADKNFAQSATLKRSGSPYYFSGQSSVARGAAITIEKGSEIFIDGSITVFGKIIFVGEPDSRIRIRQSAAGGFSAYGQDPLVAIGGEIHMLNADISDMAGLIEAYATSTVVLDSVVVEGGAGDTSSNLISVFNNSFLSVNDSSFRNINSRHGVEVFNRSQARIDRASFSRAGSDVSVIGYGSGTIISVSSSTFSGLLGGPLSTKKGIEIFADAALDSEGNTFEGFSGVAVSAFSDAHISIQGSVFTKNNIGIQSYGSDISISESELFENVESGAVLYGGTVDASNNWWGSENGPRSIELNPNGGGDMHVGDGPIAPWKSEKPAKNKKCCSSILFIPGLQGSRIYSRGVFAENQLWEPNTNSDISKLGLNSDGYSIGKGLYVRDIIDRTNILLGGNDDIEVYKGLIKSLNALNSSYSIEDWQYAAYDWRMSPNTIVVEGSRYGSPSGQYKKMEDQIVKMAAISKTKKVTLLAHSYGGLVTKRLLAYLLQRGKIGLIDKVVFVGVPENGSPSSLFALLHGDNQDIGNGYIVTKPAARAFAQNMPAAYSLLPKIDQDLIFGVAATNTISASVPSISTVDSMYKFLFKEIPRPSPADALEVNVPLIANKKIKQKIDLELADQFVRPQTDAEYSSIEFYNILGVGLNTPKSISYVKRRCPSAFVDPSLMSPNCGLDHIPNFSRIGDGTVLAHDALDVSPAQSGAVGQAGQNFGQSAAGQRWGEKYIFNMGEYNRAVARNYSHASLASAPPVISALMQIFTNNIGKHALPQYITAHGGIRMGGTSAPSSHPGSSEASSTDPTSASLISSLEQGRTYLISASEGVLVSAKDKLGNIAGVNFPLIMSADAASSGGLKKAQIIPVISSTPNSDVSYIGGSYYMHSENAPHVVTIFQNPNTPSYEFTLTIKEITSAETKVLASFENIPITEYSTAVVTAGSASTTKFEMSVTDRYEDIYASTTIYAVGSVGSGSGGGNANSGGIQTSGSVSGNPVDILQLIGRIRIEISGSNLRSNFKQRYLLRLATVEKNYRLPAAAKKSLARRHAKETTASLASIVKDLNRSRSLYYKGGMRKAEASFLQSRFVQLSRAFGD